MDAAVDAWLRDLVALLAREVDGVEEETIDSGNEDIRSGQGTIKFNSLANKIGEASSKGLMCMSQKHQEYWQ